MVLVQKVEKQKSDFYAMSRYQLDMAALWTAVRVLDLEAIPQAFLKQIPLWNTISRSFWLELFKLDVTEQTEEIKTKFCTHGH